MVTILSIIFISFLCLIIVAIKYDSIIPPLMRILKKPPVYLSFSILIMAIFLMQDWGMMQIAPGAESSAKYGFPVSRSVFILTIISAIGFGLYFLVRCVTKADDKPKEKICLTCLEIFEPQRIKSDLCPKCSGAVEDVSGVFDRNPDLLAKMKRKKT
ncbi:MAG: hypothetical protein FP816_21340 [Desulfobacteraceae bacterium]|nr:hypothetical protein [Desulfobacteraceae bacterium]